MQPVQRREPICFHADPITFVLKHCGDRRQKRAVIFHYQNVRRRWHFAGSRTRHNSRAPSSSRGRPLAELVVMVVSPSLLVRRRKSTILNRPAASGRFQRERLDPSYPWNGAQGQSNVRIVGAVSEVNPSRSGVVVASAPSSPARSAARNVITPEAPSS